MSDFITVDRNTFNRMSTALIAVEKYLAVNNTDTWISEETALELLGCSKRSLFRIKERGEIKYKRIGRQNQYSRASIEKYNQKLSS